MTIEHDDDVITSDLDFDSLPEATELASLESIISDLSTLSTGMQQRGVSRSDAVLLAQMNALPPKGVVNGYTEVPSQTNLTVTMDSAWSKIKDTADKIWTYLVDLFNKFIDWVIGGKKQDPQEVKDDAKKAETKSAELKEAVKTTSDKKAANDIMEGKHPEVAEFKQNEENSYTDLVRTCYIHPMWIADLLSYVRVLKPYLKSTTEAAKMLNDVYAEATRVKTKADLDALVSHFNKVIGEYHIGLSQMTDYMLKTEIPMMGFKKGESPVETIRNIKATINLAAKTKAKRAFEDDFPGSLSVVTKARLTVTDAVAAFRAECEGPSEKELKDLRKAIAKLKVVKPNDIYRSPFGKTNRDDIEPFIAATRKALDNIRAVNNVIMLMPDIILNAINAHIRASIRFMSAAKSRM